MEIRDYKVNKLGAGFMTPELASRLVELVDTEVPAGWVEPSAPDENIPYAGDVAYVWGHNNWRCGIVLKVTRTKILVAFTTQGALDSYVRQTASPRVEIPILLITANSADFSQVRVAPPAAPVEDPRQWATEGTEYPYRGAPASAVETEVPAEQPRTAHPQPGDTVAWRDSAGQIVSGVVEPATALSAHKGQARVRCSDTGTVLRLKWDALHLVVRATIDEAPESPAAQVGQGVADAVEAVAAFGPAPDMSMVSPADEATPMWAHEQAVMLDLEQALDALNSAAERASKLAGATPEMWRTLSHLEYRAAQIRRRFEGKGPALDGTDIPDGLVTDVDPQPLPCDSCALDGSEGAPARTCTVCGTRRVADPATGQSRWESAQTPELEPLGVRVCPATTSGEHNWSGPESDRVRACILCAVAQTRNADGSWRYVSPTPENRP